MKLLAFNRMQIETALALRRLADFRGAYDNLGTTRGPLTEGTYHAYQSLGISLA
jgi:hypothetical protein